MNKDILNFENPRKWTWYLFLFANVILIIGIGISFAITNTSSVLTYWFVPIIVCGIVSIVAASMCYYLETKELVLLKTHVPRECFFFFLLSGAIYTMALLFAFAMTGATQSITPHQPFTLSLALNFGITAFLSLISIGLYRYGKYRIEMAMYKRRRGEVLKKQEEIHKENGITKFDRARNYYQKRKTRWWLFFNYYTNI